MLLTPAGWQLEVHLSMSYIKNKGLETFRLDVGKANLSILQGLKNTKK